MPATAQPISDNYSMRFFDGNPRGVSDGSGKTVIPAKYSNIQYKGNGIFMAYDIDLKDKYKFGTAHIFNSKGHELPYRVPQVCSLLDIFSLGAHADADLDVPLESLPPDSLLRYQHHIQSGLCEQDGSVFLPLQDGIICFLKPGLGCIVWGGVGSDTKKHLNTLIDLNTRTTLPNSNESMPQNLTTRSSLLQYRSRPEPLSLPVEKHAKFEFLCPGMFLKTVDIDSGKFSPDYWEFGRSQPISRLDMFNRFLKEYDLIGMSENQVFRLLGTHGIVEPNGYSGDLRSISFTVSANGCVVNDWLHVKIAFENGRVISWRFFVEDDQSIAFTTNVVLDTVESKHGRLINARVGQQMYASGVFESPFLKTKAKSVAK